MPSRLRAPAPEPATRAVAARGTAGAHPASAGRSRAGQAAHVLEMQRGRLLAALVELAGERSLENVAIGQVCKRAGVSRRTFYELFDDRETLVLAALEHAVIRIGAHVLPAYRQAGAWCDRIRAALDVLLERLDADPGSACLCLVESMRAGPRVIQVRKRLLERLAEEIDLGRSVADEPRDLPPLTAHGVLGGVITVIQDRLLDGDEPLIGLCNSLMAIIVHPYLGPEEARRELERSGPPKPASSTVAISDPFRGLPIRFTYRTARVMATIAAHPGASNRTVAASAEIGDEGQMSRLLRRLEGCGLIENRSDGHIKGEANAWALTPRGQAVSTALGARPT